MPLGELAESGGGLNRWILRETRLRFTWLDKCVGDFALIEPIPDELFALTNEYWLSFYIDNVIYDKKFIFVPESIVESNFIRIPLLNKPGVMIA